MSACEKYVEMLEEYIDGVLDSAREDEFLSHLGKCPICSAELDAERALVEIIKEMDVIDPGDEFTRMVMARIFTPEPARQGVLRRFFGAIEAFAQKHRRLAWSPLVVVSLISAFLIPYGLRIGAVGVLSSVSDMISLLVNPLAGLITSADRVIELATPVLKAMFLVFKVFIGFLWTIAGTQQFALILISSILIVMIVSTWTFFHVMLARRRAYHAELQI
ncbi:MAG: anti-sigma factor family protein [Candidatus Glassbacteria bacterium]